MTASPPGPYWGAVCIPLPQGRHTLIDIEDFAVVSRHRWQVGSGYARTGRGKEYVSLSRLLLPPPPGMVTDHINGCKLDNRRANLRIASPRQNAMNSRVEKRGEDCPYRGVRRSLQRWKASIRVEGKRVYLGTFDTPETAALAYNAAASRWHGAFAVLNTISDPYPAPPIKSRPCGENHRCAILTWEAVREARRLRIEGCSIVELAARLGVGRTTMRHVLSGVTWKERERV